jgi:hypothetical protein
MPWLLFFIIDASSRRSLKQTYILVACGGHADRSGSQVPALCSRQDARTGAFWRGCAETGLPPGEA